MRVDVQDRRDEETILCRVRWNGPSGEMVSIVLPVSATIAEYHMVQGASDPPPLPEDIRQSAIGQAKQIARVFSEQKD